MRLDVRSGTADDNRTTVFKCESRGCEYQYVVTADAPIIETRRIVPKRVEEVVDPAQQNAGRSVVSIRCDSCGNDKAYVHQQQTRSADEGATNFYECTKCKHNWREGN